VPEVEAEDDPPHCPHGTARNMDITIPPECSDIPASPFPDTHETI
jgi:hypothetical protein